MDYNTKDFSGYVVTGFYYNTGKRFKTMHFESFMHANCINLWKGRVWGVLKSTGKRVLLKSVNC